jgi:hypothetical protein
MTAAFDDELAIEAWEGRLAPLLDAHGAAVIAALRGGTARPPWPDALRTPAVARLAARHDPGGRPGRATLSRWSLAARLDGAGMIAAARRARDRGRTGRALSRPGRRRARLGYGDARRWSARCSARRPRGAAGPAESTTPTCPAPPRRRAAALVRRSRGAGRPRRRRPGGCTVCDDGARGRHGADHDRRGVRVPAGRATWRA